jgi:hypothetical protein
MRIDGVRRRRKGRGNARLRCPGVREYAAGLFGKTALETRLEKIEKTLLSHDAALRDVIQELRPLLPPLPEPPNPRIGFNSSQKKPA